MIDNATQKYFCPRYNNTRGISRFKNAVSADVLLFSSENPLFKEIGKGLLNILLPLCLLYGSNETQIASINESTYIYIAFKAYELNFVINARPHCPVSLYSPTRGEPITAENVYLFQGDNIKPGEVQMTVMFGINPVGNPDDDTSIRLDPYAAAWVEISIAEESQLDDELIKLCLADSSWYMSDLFLPPGYTRIVCIGFVMVE